MTFFNRESEWKFYMEEIKSLNNNLLINSNFVKIDGNLTVGNNVTATKFIGDGSQLTGIANLTNHRDASFNNVDISGNLTVNGFFGGNYYGPMGSIKTIDFSRIPATSNKYYYLGQFTSHYPSHIFILGIGNNSGSGSLFTITRHYSRPPNISGILGENYYYYKFFYENIHNINTYNLWFRPYDNSRHFIDVQVRIQSFNYTFPSEPIVQTYEECKYGLIQQNEADITYIGIGTPDPNSSTSSAVSDDRLKFNKTTITNGLNVINKLNPVIYDMSPEFNNEVRTQKRSGFVAQEVYEIDDLKHTINVGNDSNPWSIHYNDIFTYNIAATKELDTIVQAQQIEINEQKTRIQQLETENTTIKNALNQLLSDAGKPTI